MKTFQLVRILVASGAFLLSCARSKTVDSADSSQLASIRIADPISSATGQSIDYANLELSIKGIGPTQLAKNLRFRKDELPRQGQNVSLPYGSYQFLLSYSNDQGKLLYQSCLGASRDGLRINEHERIHVIDKPRYEPTIMICPGSDGAEPIGSTGSQPAKQSPESTPAKSGTNGSSFPADAKFFVDTSSLAAAEARRLQQAQDPRAPFIEFIAKQGAAIW
jgi:hypothetical protein